MQLHVKCHTEKSSRWICKCGLAHFEIYFPLHFLPALVFSHGRPWRDTVVNMVPDDTKAHLSFNCYQIPFNFISIHWCWVKELITKPILNFNDFLITTSFLCNEICCFHVQPFKASDFVQYLPKLSNFILLF